MIPIEKRKRSTLWSRDDPNKPYDIKRLIVAIVDDERFLEVQQNYAKNLVVGFAHLAGQSVGIVANQPNYLAGVLDINASLKGARFVSLLRRVQYSVGDVGRRTQASCPERSRSSAA